MANYIAQRASQEGLNGAAMVAQGQATQAAGNVLKDFTSGATNKKLVAINTGVEHLDALNPLIDAMDNGNLTAINKARQYFEKQTGKPAPTNYSTLANMAVGEVSQAVMTGGGTGPERDELAAPFKSSNGPDVLRGAVKQAITALWPARLMGCVHRGTPAPTAPKARSSVSLGLPQRRRWVCPPVIVPWATRA